MHASWFLFKMWDIWSRKAELPYLFSTVLGQGRSGGDSFVLFERRMEGRSRNARERQPGRWLMIYVVTSCRFSREGSIAVMCSVNADWTWHLTLTSKILQMVRFPLNVLIACERISSDSVLLRPPSDLDDPVITVHQSVGEAKEQFYFERTVFLRCVANSNPPVRYSWKRGKEMLTQGSDSGVEIYEPFFTQVR